MGTLMGRAEAGLFERAALEGRHVRLYVVLGVSADTTAAPEPLSVLVLPGLHFGTGVDAWEGLMTLVAWKFKALKWRRVHTCSIEDAEVLYYERMYADALEGPLPIYRWGPCPRLS